MNTLRVSSETFNRRLLLMRKTQILKCEEKFFSMEMIVNKLEELNSDFRFHQFNVMAMT